jgi:hypothetical protein
MLSVAAGGGITADATGYLGGDGWESDFNETGLRGQSICNGHNAQNTAPKDGAGGGGTFRTAGNNCGAGGGGGGFGSAGAWEEFNTSCYDRGHRQNDNAGLVYGDAQLSDWLLGSGGGSGATGGTDGTSDDSGDGGQGGGLLVIYANTLQLNGEITSRGQDGEISPTITDTGNGGGGSGGTLFVSARTLTGSGSFSVAGGDGPAAQSAANSAGGDGGEGRLRIDFQQVGGFDWGTPEADAILDGFVTGGPGHTEPYLQ